MVFGRFLKDSDVFGRLSDVFGQLSDVLGRLSDVFGRLSRVFGWLLAIADGFSLIWTAFRYRERRFADRPYPFFFSFFFWREAPKKKCMKQKLAHGGQERRFADRPYPFFFFHFFLARSAKKKCMKQNWRMVDKRGAERKIFT